jgi:hypothetical protein
MFNSDEDENNTNEKYSKSSKDIMLKRKRRQDAIKKYREKKKINLENHKKTVNYICVTETNLDQNFSLASLAKFYSLVDIESSECRYDLIAVDQIKHKCILINYKNNFFHITNVVYDYEHD